MNKTTNNYEQISVCKGYKIISQIEIVLKSDYHKSLLGYEIVDWFVNEVIKLENKMNFTFKKTKKEFIMIKENEEDLKKLHLSILWKYY